MKAVMAFSTKAASVAKSTGGQSSGKKLGGLSRGLSAVGSLMEFAAGRQQSAALGQSARDEEMAARGEYITAAERITEIDKSYNQLVGSQLASVATMGIDHASGSVIAAREAAQDEADGQRKMIRLDAEANAASRRLRAVNLKTAARNAKIGGTIGLGIGLAKAAFGG